MRTRPNSRTREMTNAVRKSSGGERRFANDASSRSSAPGTVNGGLEPPCVGTPFQLMDSRIRASNRAALRSRPAPTSRPGRPSVRAHLPQR